MEANTQPAGTLQLGMLESFDATEHVSINQLSSQLANIQQELTAKRKREEEEDKQKKQRKLSEVLSKVWSSVFSSPRAVVLISISILRRRNWSLISMS